MKFIHYLTSITGVEIFPLISLLIFFLFFAALLVYAIRADKKRLQYMSALPIADEAQGEEETPQQP